MKNALNKSCLALFLAVICILCSTCVCAGEQENQENQENDILVGRIAHIEGQLLRYIPDDDDWVLTDKDTPFGEYDNLFSSEDGKVEIIMPNNTLVRINGDTQIQLIELANEVTEVDVSSGTARLYNNSSSAEIKATTPFGDVILPPATVCDIYVHETQAEVAVLKGSVRFIKAGSITPHELIAGSSSIIVNSEQIVASAHRPPPAWDGWNEERDAQWTQRMQAGGDSKKYLPESLQDNAFELDANGRWEQVNYDGAYRYFWRPVYVSTGWTPFSSGRWIVWHGEQTWVPCESFGYVTHHYGNWVYARSCWYWAPPVSGVMLSAGAPLLNIGMSWYPGRVAWVSSSISIGWFPLAPFEIYYCSKYWGPGCRVRYYNNYYDCRTYRHYRHARYVDHRRFYGSRNYRYAGLRKGRSNEKFRGSARIPEHMRRKFQIENKQRYASNFPKYRNKLKKIDVRKDSRTRQVAGRRLNTNPFKRTVAKELDKNRKAGAAIVENTSKKVVKNTQQKQQRLAFAHKNGIQARQENTGKINRTVIPKTETRKDSARTALRSFQQPSKKIAEKPGINHTQVKKPVSLTAKKTLNSRRSIQASAPNSRQTSRQNVVTVKQTKASRNLYTRNTNSGSTSLSGRSTKTFSAQTNSRASTAFTQSARQHSTRQNSTGRMQVNGARGRL